MFQKILHFIKYNNAAIIILAVILILGGGALAAGPEVIGQRETSLQGVDNAALLSADLDKFNMDFKIENLEQDEKYYYATYSFLDLAVADNLWQYQLSQRRRKISKKIQEDLGLYLAKFLAKHHEARVRELKQEKNRAEARGEQRRVEVTEYSGLIGRALDLAAKVFPGYEPVVKRELPTPDFTISTPLTRGDEGGFPPKADQPRAGNSPAASGVDNLTRIYNDYVAEHPEIFSQNQTDASSTPADSAGSPLADSAYTPSDEADTAAPTENVTPAIPEPESVDVIELPASPAAEPTPAPVPETAP